MKATNYLHAAFTAVCVCISLVGYYRYGSVPLLELTLGLASSRAASSHHPGSLCNCSSLASEAAAEPGFIGSHHAVENVIPLQHLKKKISFSKHKGLSYLDHTGLNRFYLCSPKAGPIASEVSSSKQCRERTFLDRKSPIVGLVSTPGSGNTWLRHLLEQATGIFTGSVYCDNSLKAVFPGEYVVGGNVLVVKTHRGDTRELPEDVQAALGKTSYDRAVVIVRDPYDALLSEANRRWNSKKTRDSHVGLANEMAFIGNSKWDWYVEFMSTTWAYLLHTWLAHDHLPVHVVQYERLLTSPRQELSRLLEFVGFPADNGTLDCVLENSGDAFRRKNHLNFDPYSKDNKAVVNRVLTQATPLLAQYGISYKKR